jgi:nucleotide-binding universal stress UspA family protein
MKTMTILIDGSENDRSSLVTAVAFCRALDGRLRVVHARPEAAIIVVPEAVVPMAEIDIGPMRAAARAAYDEVCGGLSFAEWVETEHTEAQAIVSNGLFSDVMILERVSSEAGSEVLALNTALFETPGPVLVTPPSPASEIGKSVAVVWSPTTQSARAVRSALPVLSKADKVTIITSSENPDPAPLARYLEIHGIKTASSTFGGGGLTARARGRAILAAVTSIKADLLVMGAYGENRLSTLMGLGRATQKIVSATTIPALVQR